MITELCDVWWVVLLVCDVWWVVLLRVFAFCNRLSWSPFHCHSHTSCCDLAMAETSKQAFWCCFVIWSDCSTQYTLLLAACMRVRCFAIPWFLVLACLCVRCGLGTHMSRYWLPRTRVSLLSVTELWLWRYRLLISISKL